MEERRPRSRHQRNIRLIRRRQRQIMIFSGVVLCAAILILGLIYILLQRTVSGYPEGEIFENIYIGSVNVSGMSRKEALDTMEKNLEKGRQAKVAMQVDTKTAESSLEDLGLGYSDIKKTVDTAYRYGKTGSLWKRYWKLRKLKKEKLVLKERYVLSKKKAVKTIREKAVPLADHAVDATMVRSGEHFLITEAKKGVTIHIRKSLSSIQKKLNKHWNCEDFTVKMVMKEERPKVTKKDLETVTDKLGSYSTDAGGGERIQNLRTGVGKINGTILAPGEEISVHEVTAPYDAEHGYVAAGSYENGQVVETYGGGICQVSTTLYNAVLYAELEVTERYPHSMLVSYIDPSRDAAIAGDVKDLKFKNNYNTPVFIEGGIDANNQLTVTIYGKDTRKKGRTVEYESETTATEEYGRTYKEDSSAPLGSMEYSGSPHTGKTARLWKIVKENGKEVSRDVINESVYQKSDEIILVGTASDNGTASGIVSGAIATQDGSRINAAIAKAQAME